jgi:TonB family protein
LAVLACLQLCVSAQSATEKTSHELISDAAKLRKRDLRKLELQSNAGDQLSQLLLGIAHRHGFATKQNNETAAMWISKAAQAGEPTAQTMLGRFFIDAIGVPQNQDEAIIWFRRAADQGNVEGQFELAEAYERGVGVPPDRAQANALYQMAADSGFAPAKCALRAYDLQYVRVEKGEKRLPRVLYAPDPEYSGAARALKFSGTVELWVGVGENSRVRKVCVRRPLGFGLDEKAVAAIRRWTFEPYIRNGQRVPFGVNISSAMKLY